jgi:hypothetical protein
MAGVARGTRSGHSSTSPDLRRNRRTRGEVVKSPLLYQLSYRVGRYCAEEVSTAHDPFGQQLRGTVQDVTCPSRTG